MKLHELMTQLEQHYPLSLAENWDQVGLHFGNLESEVRKVLVTLDVDNQVVEEAIQLGVDTIVVHHPPLFKPIQRFDQQLPNIAAYTQLIKHDINVYAMHTNFDRAWNGMNDWLCEQLDLQEIRSLIAHEDVTIPSIGRVGTLKKAFTRQEVIDHIKQKFGVARVTTIEKQPKPHYQTIAILGGAGVEYAKYAVDCQADIFITGDIAYHHGQTCYHYPMMTIDVGHYIESIFTTRMATQLQQNYPQLEVIASCVNTNPFRYE